MRTVMFAGEVLPPKYLVEWMRAMPHADFFNCYGPTEATGISMCYHVSDVPKDKGERVPIGVPCKKGTRAYVLSEDGEPVPSGEIGELCLSGPCLSPGYWNDSDMTRKVFIPNPIQSRNSETVYRTGDLVCVREDGCYEFIGREDEQIKLMGYRIECGDIEHHVCAIDGVYEAAAVITHREEDALGELVVFYVGDKNLTPGVIQRELGRLLPKHMIPRQYVQLKEIPRSSTGKVQRSELARFIEG
jgi:acyl-coenzyme A synthetase/AMP-(fatty) acid ligase